jgi:hypothetical protein
VEGIVVVGRLSAEEVEWKAVVGTRNVEIFVTYLGCFKLCLGKLGLSAAYHILAETVATFPFQGLYRKACAAYSVNLSSEEPAST